MAALGLWSVDRSVATAFAGTLHLTQFGFIVGLGVVFLLIEGINLKDVVARSREEFS